MAFAVVCKNCQSRFLLNDDLLRRRVAGKAITVRCRQCQATIEVDAASVDAPEPPRAAPQPAAATVSPAVPRPMTLKAAPHPPRPAKSSTLIGIGGPARPPGSTELVALSPGLLDVPKQAPVDIDDFPEPPEPPPSFEDLDADAWEITDAPPRPALAPPKVEASPQARAPKQLDTAPESVDDFIEELPPSIPPSSSDDEPTRLIPAKVMQEHAEHEARAARLPSDELTPVDLSLTGKTTLPLFALGEDGAAASTPPKHAPAPVPKPPHRPEPVAAPPSSPEGSLSPASLDPPRLSDRPDSVRTRKNVVAPESQGEPSRAHLRRSGLAVPIAIALAAAAGLLIWKRGTAPGPSPVAHREPASIALEKPAPAPEPAATGGLDGAHGESAAASAPPAEASADDVTFETNPAPKTAAAPRPERAVTGATAPARAIAPEPREPRAEPEPSPARPSEPAAPSGPVGDFDPSAAAAALTSSAAQASACRKEGDPSGVANVVITFAPSGRVTSANISGPPFAGTPTGGCIAALLRKARVPAFDGERVTVSKTIVVQ